MKIGLLFDLDGTLLDTLGDLTDATNYALRQFGFPERSEAEIRSFVGNGARNLILQAMGVAEDDSRIDTVLAVYKQYYDAHCQIRTAPKECTCKTCKQHTKCIPKTVNMCYRLFCHR